MGLPPPLVPTKSPNPSTSSSDSTLGAIKAISSNDPSRPPSVSPSPLSSSAAPSSSSSSSQYRSFPSSTVSSSHTRWPSDDFGAFVEVPKGQDPLGMAIAASSSGSTSGDLLSFSPARELGGFDLLEQARERDAHRHRDLDALFTAAADDGRELPTLQTSRSQSHRYHDQSQSSSSSVNNLARSPPPPRRLSHIMSPEPSPASFHHQHPPPHSRTSSSNAQVTDALDDPWFFKDNNDHTRDSTYQPSFPHHDKAEDFFSPEIRKLSLDPSPLQQPQSSSSRHSQPNNASAPPPNPQLAPSERSLPSLISGFPQPQPNPYAPRLYTPSSTSSSNRASPPRRSPNHSPNPASPSSSSHPASHPASLLPTLLKSTSRWTSLLSSSPNSSSLQPNSSPSSNSTTSTLTHTSPFASQSRDSSSYIPPSGAPGFRPWQSASEEEEALRQSHLRNDSAGSEEDWSVRLVGRRPETTPVLMEGEAKQLRACLPPRQKVSGTWSLLYSIDQHGTALSTLYRQTDRFASIKGNEESGNILVIRTGGGEVFGGFLGEAFHPRSGAYYGTGESFLFKSIGEEGQVRIFKWSGQNTFYVLSDTHCLSMGDSVGLYIDSELAHGSTARSLTFANEPLASESKFEVLGLEVWGIGGGSAR